MASLYRRPNSPFWWARLAVQTADGMTTVYKSTKRKVRREAQRIAQELEEAENGNADDVTGAKLVGILKDAAAVAARGSLSEPVAREFLRKIYEASGGRELTLWTVESWLEGWLERKRKRTRPATVARYENSAKLFRSFMGVRLELPMEVVTKDDLRAFQDQIDDGRRQPRTVNHICSDIFGVFRAAVLDGVIVASPAAGISKLKEPESTSREPFDADEIAKIYCACPSEDWRGMLLLGALAGLRLSDAAKLKAGSISKAGEVDVLKFVAGKTGTQVLVPMHPDLSAFFDTHPRTEDDESPLFPSLANRTPGGRKGLSATFGDICDAAGIDRRLIAKKGKDAARTRYARGYHSLRHSFVSGLANAGVNEERRKLLVAHRDRNDVHQLYTHTQIGQLKADVGKLPSVVCQQAA